MTQSTQAQYARRMTVKPLFFIEVTDTFGGDANYSWATRHLIRASSVRGAVNRFSRLSGLSWRAVGCDRYDSKSGATCLFIEHWDGEADRLPRLNTDDRNAKGA